MTVPVGLAEACEVWQSGRDGGSTPIRAAARILTGNPHYFSAPFIDELDRKAADDGASLDRARILMGAIRNAEPWDTDRWRASLNISGVGAASRGIAPKVGIDEQIEALVVGPDARITMPLWGFSLSEDIALGFGSRFLFRLRGPFYAVAAWVHSGVQGAEQELIGSGVYRVVGTFRRDETLVVDLEQDGHVAVIR